MRGPTMPYEPTIQARHLNHTFTQSDGKETLLRDVSLDLYAGRMTLLEGPAGSGKPTLLTVLSGLVMPDSGEVVTTEGDLWKMAEWQRDDFRLRHCGFLFQSHTLFPDLTARQQLE